MRLSTFFEYGSLSLCRLTALQQLRGISSACGALPPFRIGTKILTIGITAAE
jgi:hypothetical protein